MYYACTILNLEYTFTDGLSEILSHLLVGDKEGGGIIFVAKIDKESRRFKIADFSVTSFFNGS